MNIYLLVCTSYFLLLGSVAKYDSSRNTSILVYVPYVVYTMIVLYIFMYTSVASTIHSTSYMAVAMTAAVATIG